MAPGYMHDFLRSNVHKKINFSYQKIIHIFFFLQCIAWCLVYHQLRQELYIKIFFKPKPELQFVTQKPAQKGNQ